MAPLPQPLLTHTHTRTSGKSQSCSLSRSLRAALLFGLPTQANGGSFVLVLVHPIRMCWCVAAAAAGWANGNVASLRWILSRTILSKWKWNSETARKIFELKWIHQRQRQRQRHRQHLWSLSIYRECFSNSCQSG